MKLTHKELLMLLGIIIAVAGTFYVLGKRQSTLEKSFIQRVVMPENIVTIPVPSTTIYESGDGTCTTARDCPDRCGEQTIKMYGNRSHCPIIECSDGKCIYKLVP